MFCWNANICLVLSLSFHHFLHLVSLPMTFDQLPSCYWRKASWNHDASCADGVLLGDWAMSVFHSKVFGVIVVQEVTLGVCPVIGEFFFSFQLRCVWTLHLPSLVPVAPFVWQLWQQCSSAASLHEWLNKTFWSPLDWRKYQRSRGHLHAMLFLILAKDSVFVIFAVFLHEFEAKCNQKWFFLSIRNNWANFTVSQRPDSFT